MEQETYYVTEPYNREEAYQEQESYQDTEYYNNVEMPLRAVFHTMWNRMQLLTYQLQYFKDSINLLRSMYLYKLQNPVTKYRMVTKYRRLQNTRCPKRSAM